MRYLIVFICFLLSGCVNLSPLQEALFHTSEPDQSITAEELRELLPDFAEIGDGNYKLVPRGIMPRAAWCNPFASDIMQPKDWSCKDYSQWAADKMQGYAFGRAWDQEHMVNIFLDTERNVILYDAQVCQFVRQPINHIVIVLKEPQGHRERIKDEESYENANYL